MKLLGIAIVGKCNEPLYLCDCTKIVGRGGTSAEEGDNKSSNDNQADAEEIIVEDYYEFGLTRATVPPNKPQSQSLSTEDQMLFHASLDYLEERIGASKPDGSMPMRFKNDVNSNRAIASWLGLITVLDDFYAIYGHVSATNVKFLALCVEEPSDKIKGAWSRPFDFSAFSKAAANSSSTNNKLRQASPETKVKTLLASIHQHYIEYVMNPFCQTGVTIQSTQFDQNIQRSIAEYYDLDHEDNDDTTEEQ